MARAGWREQMRSIDLPQIFQGGMGAGVSNWRLARAVAESGALGIVSGTGLDTILVRRLQLGDPDGTMRQALESFPIARIAEKIVGRYYVAGGIGANEPFKLVPMASVAGSRESIELLVAANFVEVFLAKHGHDAPVGINYLEKIQLPTLPSLYGAMLAGVDVVAIGAGLPVSIPAVIDAFVAGEAAKLTITVEDNGDHPPVVQRFDPAAMGFPAGELPRPLFLPIVSSDVIAGLMVRRAAGRVDGLIVEHHRAGGHNAPPRRARQTAPPSGDAFGPRDEPKLEAIRELQKPFWLAGGYGTPERLAEALEEGAKGVQIGSTFALCRESGMREDLRLAAFDRIRDGTLTVETDLELSPTGYPFKVTELEPAVEGVPDSVRRASVRCDLGYLRSTYRRADGSVGYRCPAEPLEQWTGKGGAREDIDGKVCLCNRLLSTVGFGQRRGVFQEKAIITLGSDLASIRAVTERCGRDYSAADVIGYLTA